MGVYGFGMFASYGQVGFGLSYSVDTSMAVSTALQVVVMRFERGVVVPVDTVMLPLTFPFSTEVVLPEGSSPGLYLVSVDGGRPFELILHRGRFPTVSGSTGELRGGQARIGRSLENEAYYQFVNLAAETDVQVAALIEKRLGLEDTDPDYYSSAMRLEDDLFRLQSRFNRQLDSLGLLYAHTFVADELLPMARFPSPTMEQRDRYGTNRSFLFEHYFGAVEVTGEFLPDNHVFHNRVKYYLQTVAPAGDAFQKQAIDNILAHSRKFPSHHGHVAEMLILHYFNERRDELVLYVHERYVEDNCSDESLRVDDIVAGLRLNRIGTLAEELLLSDTSGNAISLRKIAFTSAATVLLFWSAQCSVCMEEIPELIRLHSAYRDRGLSVYAVNLDADRNDWIEAIRRLGTGWTDVHESRLTETSMVQTNYRVRQTPSLYLIDQKGQVMARGIFGYELEARLHELINGLRGTH